MPSSSNAVFYQNGQFVDYFGNVIDITNMLGTSLSGPTGPTGSDGATGPTGSTAPVGAVKFVKEFATIGSGGILNILRSDLEAAMVPNDGYILAGGTGTGASAGIADFADMVIQVWVLEYGVPNWRILNPTTASGIGVSSVALNEFTGDINITIGPGSFTATSRVRVVIIA